MNLKGIFTKIDEIVKKVFTPQNIQVAASVADIAMPQFSAMTNTVASGIITAEALAKQAGYGQGSGLQKAGYVIGQSQAIYDAWAQSAGFNPEPAKLAELVKFFADWFSSHQAAGSTGTTSSPQNPATANVPSGVMIPLIPSSEPTAQAPAQVPVAPSNPTGATSATLTGVAVQPNS